MSFEFQNLIHQSDMAWYWYLFSKDPLFSRINQASIHSLIFKAVKSGIDEASRIIQEFGTHNVDKIYDLMEIEIEESEDNSSLGIYYLSIFEPNNGVRVFVNQVHAVGEIITSKCGSSFLLPATVKSLLLAHELYHVCEDRNPDLFTEQYRMPLWRVGPFTHKSPVRALSEIGAAAFTKELCAVEYNPFILNYALLLSVAPQSANKLYKEVIENSAPMTNS